MGLLDHVSDTPCLGHHQPGISCLSPAPKAPKTTPPIHRCSRCGCWATTRNSILAGGVLQCRVCLGGHVPPHEAEEESS